MSQHPAQEHSPQDGVKPPKSLPIKLLVKNSRRRSRVTVPPTLKKVIDALHLSFPDLIERDINIEYTDEENDVITVGSDAELLEAVEVFKQMNRILSFTVRVTPKPVDTTTTSTPPLLAETAVSMENGPNQQEKTCISNAGLAEAVHFGVTCDGSNQSPLVGLRFHKIGFDYDLNAECFAQLPPEEQQKYECILFPGAQPFPIQVPHATPQQKVKRWRCGGRGRGRGHGRGRGRGCGRGWFPALVRRHFQKARQANLTMSFVKDVTINDGDTVLDGEKFEKTWLVDTGASAWPEGCALVHVGGDLMGATPVIPVAAQTANSKVQLSVNFTAPSQPGRFRSRWRMITPQGRRFGHALWAVIKIPPPSAQLEQQVPGRLTVPVDLQLVNGSRATLLPRNKVFAMKRGGGRGHFATVTVPSLPILEETKGRWMYEVILQTDGCMQIGFCTPQFDCKPWRGSGVGDDCHSWAIDCQRLLKWHGEKSFSYARRWGTDGWVQWKAGDVIGCIFDADQNEISFAWNGYDLGVAFSVPPCTRPLFPAVSLSAGQGVQFVLEGPIQFPMKEAAPFGEILLQPTHLAKTTNMALTATAAANQEKIEVQNDKTSPSKNLMGGGTVLSETNDADVTIESLDVPQETNPLCEESAPILHTQLDASMNANALSTMGGAKVDTVTTQDTLTPEPSSKEEESDTTSSNDPPPRYAKEGHLLANMGFLIEKHELEVLMDSVQGSLESAINKLIMKS